MRLLAILGALVLMFPGAARGQTTGSLVLSADEPLGAWINGLPVALAITTATVDHVILNDRVVRESGLVAAPPDRIANLVIGGAVARVGRHGRGLLTLAERPVRQELFWFPGASPLPVDGSIGPFALPAATVTVRWGHAATSAHGWPLVGGIDHAAYGIARAGKRPFLFGVDIRTRRPLPVVSASTGADLVDELGGQLVGPAWQEEIMLGVRRPVRRLRLDRPLTIGPMTFPEVAVRVGGIADSTNWLSPDQKPLPDADADPAETLVRGRTGVRRPVARMIVLSRNHLEAQGCLGLTVAKRARRFVLHCAAEGLPQPAAETATAAVPLLPPAVPVDSGTPMPVLTADGWLVINADAPLAARILDQPVTLLPDSGLPPGLYLNEATAARLPGVQADFAGELRRGDSTVPLMGMTGVGVHVAGRSGPRLLAWSQGAAATRNGPADGIIDIAALPHHRVRVRLPAATPQLPILPLTLPLARGDDLAAAGGEVRLPGVRDFALHGRLREQWPLPIATPLLADELATRFGGTWQGPAEPADLAFGIRTWLRPMRLARPLQIGPLRFEAVAVEMAMAPPARGDGRARARRALELSRRQLAEQGCTGLGIDRQARLWELACAGPPPRLTSTPVAAMGAHP